MLGRQLIRIILSLNENKRKNKEEHKLQESIVKTYKGSQQDAIAAFQSDSTKMAAERYYPTSQAWAPGAYGCGSFIVALLLCFILIGFLIFLYMLIVKPDGTLTVTYAYKTAAVSTVSSPVEDEKTCPQCAEQVKAAAKICRYCGHSFA